MTLMTLRKLTAVTIVLLLIYFKHGRSSGGRNI